MRKRIIAVTSISIAMAFLTVAMTIDCWEQLTLDVNSALAQLQADNSHCADIAVFASQACYNEANIAFNYNIDQALIDFDRCQDD